MTNSPAIKSNTTEEMLEVIQAKADGKEVQFKQQGQRNDKVR
jgi:hypothetical protein